MSVAKVVSIESGMSTRTKEKDKIPSCPSQSSANPGAWVTKMYEEGIQGNQTGESFQTVLAIIDAYRPRKSGPDFLHTEEVVESHALCASGTSVNMVHGTFWGAYAPYGLSAGRDTSKKLGGTSKVIPASSAKALNAAYYAWKTEPTGSSRDALWISLHGFLENKAGYDLLEKQDLSKDFLSEFVAEYIFKLEMPLAAGEVAEGTVRRGKEIQDFAKYTKAVWNNRRKKELKKLNERNQWMLSSTHEAADGSGRGGLFSKEEQYAYEAFDGELEVALDADERRERRLAKLASLPPDIRDYVALKMSGFRDVKICELKGKSRQTVGRLKQKAKKAIQQLPLTQEVA